MLFKRTWVDNFMRDGAIVFWEMDSLPGGPNPEFTAEWSRTTNGTWTPVTDVPVYDTYFIVDPTPHLWAKEIDLYYRVHMVSGGYEEYSLPVRADGGMPRKFWLQAKEIVRLEYLHMINGPSGVNGCLLKRRNWGERCPVCTDHDTGLVNLDKCFTCYGTGIVGGYYDAADFWILPQPPPKQTTRNSPAGHTTKVDIRARCVAYPMVSPGDIWVSNEDGRRYVIGEGSHQITEATRVKNKPIVLLIDMGLAPASHIAYDIPLEACAQERSYSGPEEDPCEPEAEPAPEPVQASGPASCTGFTVPDY